MVKVLCLDATGVPHRWITPRQAAEYQAAGGVLWDLGGTVATFRGGWNRAGVRSMLTVPAIVAIVGSVENAKRYRVPAVSRESLFARDRFQCAYCGLTFAESDLTMDHVVPQSLGGASTWMNLVTADKRCNSAKGARAVAQFRPLLYLPYVPNRAESFILRNRRILADQQAFLLASVPKHSRLHGLS